MPSSTTHKEYSQILDDQNQNTSYEEDRIKKLIDQFEKCSFCQSLLIFNREFHSDTLQIVEVSCCPNCQSKEVETRFGIH